MPTKLPPTLFPVCQANDWFYVYTGPTGEKAIDRIAVWARMLDRDNPEGVVVGLVPVRHDAGRAPSLIVPQTSEGCYVHLDDLSEKELSIINRYRKSAG